MTDGEHTSPLYKFVVTARPHTITMVTQANLMVFPGKMPKKKKNPSEDDNDRKITMMMNVQSRTQYSYDDNIYFKNWLLVRLITHRIKVCAKPI